MKRITIWGLAIAGIAFVIWSLIYQPDPPRFKNRNTDPPENEKPSAQSKVYIPPRESLPGQPALHSVNPEPNRPEDRSPIADRLNRSNQTISADLTIVRNLLAEYRRAFGEFPTGESNAQIVNALSGNNQKKLAFLDRRNAAINSQGELVDRWGTPFFFHIISSQEIELRSAGEDRQFYTGDDQLRLH